MATHISQTMNNDNVNVIKKNNNNVNDNVSNKEKHIDFIVKDIMIKLNSDDQSKLFICKAAWHLSEGVIYSNLEQALKGNNPQKYFTWLCKRCM